MMFNEGHWEMQQVEIVGNNVRVYYNIYNSYDVLQLSPSYGELLSARWLPNGKVEVVVKTYGGRRVLYYKGPDEQPEWGPTFND
jgi:hypothetical protein